MLKSRHTFFGAILLLPVPVFAQSTAENAVGGGIGLLLGLLITIVIGAIVGWIASKIVKGTGSGFWLDVVLGIGGAFLAGIVTRAVGMEGAGGIIGSLIAAVIGAVVLILIVRAVRR